MAVTPTGYADAMEGDLFLMPEERNIQFSRFLDIMQSPASASGVFYIQKQNSNLTEEFGEIIDDVEAVIPWASQAFGKKPDAVNFWMGDERAVTSSKCLVLGGCFCLLTSEFAVHKNPYENIYCVVRGYKEIILQPPTDLPWIPYRHLRSAVYKETDDDKDSKSLIVVGLENLKKVLKRDFTQDGNDSDLSAEKSEITPLLLQPMTK